MLLHVSEFLCYPRDKQHCSVCPEEDLVLCYWQGCDPEGPCVPYKRCWCLCYGNALYIWCLSNPFVCWDPFGRNPWPLWSPAKWYLEKGRQDTTETAHNTGIVSLSWHLRTPVACSKVYRGVVVQKEESYCFAPVQEMWILEQRFWHVRRIHSPAG